VFLEAITYRFRGHSMADPEFYRDKDEAKQWRSLDPTVTFRQKLIAEGALDEAGATALQAEIEKAVDDAVRFADESPPPPLEALHRDVYWTEPTP
jgi:pyruvate dehydrogenase E1 component alpha subunit